MPSTAIITVSGFRFCDPHGLEVCDDCECDWRSLNNMHVEKAVEAYEEDHQRLILKNIKDRPTFRLYYQGSLKQSPDSESVFRCNKHDEGECAKCFGFVKSCIKFGMKDVKPTRVQASANRVNVVETDGTRPLNSVTVKGPAYVPPGQDIMRKLGEGRLAKLRRPGSHMPAGTTRPIMSYPNDPRRFVPSSPDARPQDLFVDAPDRSLNHFRRWFHREDDTTILALTCGVCLDAGSPEKRRAGWGFVYNANDPGQFDPLEGTVGGEEQTSNRAELRAIIGYLQMRIWEAGGANRMVIATDSEYVVDGVCNRLDTWISRRWKNTKGSPIAHRDLWIALKRELDSAATVQLEVLFWLIPRDLNQRAYDLAVKAALNISNQRDTQTRIVRGMMF